MTSPATYTLDSLLLLRKLMIILLLYIQHLSQLDIPHQLPHILPFRAKQNLRNELDSLSSYSAPAPPPFLL